MRISEVQARFVAGQEATADHLCSRLDASGAGLWLVSYDTPIAVRRLSDGQIFVDGHRYSVTTSQHQIRGSYPTVSFRCLVALEGGDWWTRAEVLDFAPRRCTSQECSERYAYEAEVASAALRTALALGGKDANLDHLAWPPSCYWPDAPGHDRDVQGVDWPFWALLRFGGRYVLCGGERGKRSADPQLFAALLPSSATTIEAALDDMRPVGCDVRQGDLYFKPLDPWDPWTASCVASYGPPLRRRAIPVLRYGADASSHVADWLMIDEDGRVFVRGRVRHPQHKMVTLKSWHLVRIGRAREVATSSYYIPMGRGGYVYGD